MSKHSIILPDEVHGQLAEEAIARSTATQRVIWADVAREVLTKWAKRRQARLERLEAEGE